jgi:hypothetical protein
LPGRVRPRQPAGHSGPASNTSRVAFDTLPGPNAGAGTDAATARAHLGRRQENAAKAPSTADPVSGFRTRDSGDYLPAGCRTRLARLGAGSRTAS